MYLKKFKIQNFRNFGIENNEIEFVNSAGVQVKSEVDKGYIIQNSYQDNSQMTQLNDGEINVAAVTTLIVGKNNAGKTTIITALDKLINKSGDKKFYASDFNYNYLSKCLDNYLNNNYEEVPYMEFKIGIALEENSTDRLTNLVPFMLLEDVENSELEICIRYEIKEKQVFLNQLVTILGRYKRKNKKIILKKLLDCIEESSFVLNYYDKNNAVINEKIKLSNLMDLEIISANLVKKDTGLTDAFNKIISYRYETVIGEKKGEIEKSFDTINAKLTGKVEKHHTKDINKALRKVVSEDIVKVNLSADLTLEKLINKLIKYEYVESDFNIPENQFGLGYTNLMMIIAALLDYVEKYPDTEFNSKINLLAIEEPETHMHPQMQELFIKNINDVLQQLIGSRNKNINSQLIITTHSSHILNSKIHSGNSFDNINYVYKKDNSSCVVKLNNSIIMPQGVTDEESAEFRFLKKHIKYKVSELFFSDAVIFVEGFSEETILPFYIEKNNILNKHYISVFSVNGAHAYMYSNMIKALGVPTMIITDLDIEKKDDEKSKQIKNLNGRKTTNKTISCFKTNNELFDIEKFMIDDNIYISYQGKINGYYATSFEEAIILTNYDNAILNEVLKKIKPKKYEEIVGDKYEYAKNKSNSNKWQVALSGEKGKFASDLLYAMIESESGNIPKLPKYISDGLKWIGARLKEGR